SPCLPRSRLVSVETEAEVAEAEELAAEVGEAAARSVLHRSVPDNRSRQEQKEEQEQRRSRNANLNLGPCTLFLPALPFRWHNGVAGCLLLEPSSYQRFQGLMALSCF